MQTVAQRAVPINALKLAHQGDARALLAIPEARKDIPRLIAGQPAKRTYSYEWRQCLPLATELGNRKAIAEAKRLIAEREARREARKAAETARTPRPGRILADAAVRRDKQLEAEAKRLIAEREARREARKAAETARTPRPGRILADAAVRRDKQLEAERQAVESRLDGLLDRCYRCASSSWAGGENKNIITLSDAPSARGDTSKAWSKNGKWSGQDLARRVNVSPTWTRDVDQAGLAVVDGLVTTHAKLIESRDGIEVFEAAWVRQSRGMAVEAERGFIARTTDRKVKFHSTASAKAAVVGLKRKLTAQGLDPAEAKARRDAAATRRAEIRAAQLAKLIDRVTRWDLGEIANVSVRRADSIQAGNCVPGTDAFIDRFFPDRGPDATATIGEIAKRAALTNPLSLSGDLLTLARQVAAACLVAIRRDRNARRSLMA